MTTYEMCTIHSAKNKWRRGEIGKRRRLKICTESDHIICTYTKQAQHTSPYFEAASKHFSVHISISRKILWYCSDSSLRLSDDDLSTNEEGRMVSSQSKMIMALLFDVGGDMVATQEGTWFSLLQCYFYELISSLQNTLLGGRVEWIWVGLPFIFEWIVKKCYCWR